MGVTERSSPAQHARTETRFGPPHEEEGRCQARSAPLRSAGSSHEKSGAYTAPGRARPARHGTTGMPPRTTAVARECVARSHCLRYFARAVQARKVAQASSARGLAPTEACMASSLVPDAPRCKTNLWWPAGDRRTVILVTQQEANTWALTWTAFEDDQAVATSSTAGEDTRLLREALRTAVDLNPPNDKSMLEEDFENAFGDIAFSVFHPVSPCGGSKTGFSAAAGPPACGP